MPTAFMGTRGNRRRCEGEDARSRTGKVSRTHSCCKRITVRHNETFHSFYQTTDMYEETVFMASRGVLDPIPSEILAAHTRKSKLPTVPPSTVYSAPTSTTTPGALEPRVTALETTLGDLQHDVMAVTRDVEALKMARTPSGTSSRKAIPRPEPTPVLSEKGAGVSDKPSDVPPGKGVGSSGDPVLVLKQRRADATGKFEAAKGNIIKIAELKQGIAIIAKSAERVKTMEAEFGEIARTTPLTLSAVEKMEDLVKQIQAMQAEVETASRSATPLQPETTGTGTNPIE